mgnify:CR=1 FL=1
MLKISDEFVKYALIDQGAELRGKQYLYKNKTFSDKELIKKEQKCHECIKRKLTVLFPSTTTLKLGKRKRSSPAKKKVIKKKKVVKKNTPKQPKKATKKKKSTKT